MSKPELRAAERTAFCRSCDKEITKGQHIVSLFSRRNRGQYIHFCLYCAEDIGKLVLQYVEVAKD